MEKVILKRKLYKRGSSYETTIPRPLLFDIDIEKKTNVLFVYLPEFKIWTIRFEQEK